MRHRLSNKRPAELAIPVLLCVSAGLVLVGQTLPVVRTDRLLDGMQSYSILSSVQALYRDSQVGLAAIVFSFSIAFPLLKLVTLGYLWWQAHDEPPSPAPMLVLRALGKWSMLDVLVVAVMVVVIDLGILADTSAEYGVYVFGGGVLLSMLTTHALSAVEGWEFEGLQPHSVPFWIPLLAAGLLVLIAYLPYAGVLSVEKFWFWENTFTLESAFLKLWNGGRPWIAAFGLFAVGILPAASCLAWIVLWAVNLRSEVRVLSRIALLLDEWAMLDVFALALIVFSVKAGQKADLVTLEGYRWILVAGGVAAFLSFVARYRVVRAAD